MSWKQSKLGFYFEITSSKRVFKSEWTDSGVPFYRAREVVKLAQEGFVDNELFITEKMYEEYKEKYGVPVAGDLLVTGVGTLGKVYVVKEGDKFYFKDGNIIWLKKIREIDSKFLEYAFKTRTIQEYIQNAPGATVGTYTIEKAKETPLPVPPLAEQKRIAAILDKADSLRRKRQQAIQLADQFLRAVFLDMFGDPVTNPKGWDEIVLKEIADIRSGVTKGKKVDSSKTVTLPYMRVANVQDGYLDLSDIQKISVSLNDAEKYQLKKGDILLTEGGDPDKLGRGYVWNNEIENCIHQNHIFSVRINDKNKIRPAFLSAVIASQRGKRYFLKVGKQTTGIATINKTVLSEFKPFIPPVEVQDKFIAAVNKLNRSKHLFSKGDLNLFSSLSQKAFASEL